MGGLSKGGEDGLKFLLGGLTTFGGFFGKSLLFEKVLLLLFFFFGSFTFHLLLVFPFTLLLL